jgi:YfiR/HmsC-like
MAGVGSSHASKRTRDRATGWISGRRRLAVLLAWCLLAGSRLFAQQEKPSEYQVKAAYLYNFGKFVQWPSKPMASSDADSGPFAICVIGKGPMGQALAAIVEGEKLDGKTVTARTLERMEEASSCRILYIAASEEPHVKRISAWMEGKPVLTVSDIPKFTQYGGMIEFVIEEDKVRFDVNRTASEKAGLTLSSQLLKVARHVSSDK